MSTDSSSFILLNAISPIVRRLAADEKSIDVTKEQLKKALALIAVTVASMMMIWARPQQLMLPASYVHSDVLVYVSTGTTVGADVGADVGSAVGTPS
tara:strand:- start:714 stop:1004 length:291 start_codon:yes stop_codon:yes gene_type:complete